MNGDLTTHGRAKCRRMRCGFTLIELLVVITVISILAGMLLVAVSIGRGTAKIKSTEGLISEVGMAIEFFRQANDKLPAELVTDESGNPLASASAESLAYLLGRQETFVQLREGATSDIDDDGAVELVDAWDQPLVYNRWFFQGDDSSEFVGGSSGYNSYPPIHNAKSFDLFSVGSKANRIPALVPTEDNVGDQSYDIAATSLNSDNSAYLYESYTPEGAKTPNKYIGNW
jgi:prepilin-type N-terminal cleavage/methylation domain-containing protein